MKCDISQCHGCCTVETKEDSSVQIQQLWGKLHLVENERLQQICGAAKIYQHPMHIKTANKKGEYKCIILGHNDPISVYWGKGYGAVYRLSLFLAIACVDSVYLGFDRGCSQKLLLLAF